MQTFLAGRRYACSSSARALVLNSPPLCLRYSQLRRASAATAQKTSAPRLEESDAYETVEKTSPTSKAVEEDTTPFTSLKGLISYDTLKAITVRPFQHINMTPVQARVLALLPSLARPFGLKSHAEFSAGEDESALVNRDLLVQAKTGTGKTLAFLVPAIEARLQSIEAHAKQAVIDSGRPGDKNLTGQAARAFTRNTVGTLIISPTRELASQIAKEALKLSAHHDDFGVHLFVGGESKARQLGEFTRGRKDIVVATPGRLRDLLESDARVADPMAKAQTLVLDEADTILDMGFRDDLEAIVDRLPDLPERQTFLFSATISNAIQQIARKYLTKGYTFIKTISEYDSPVHDRIPQYYTALESAEHQLPHVVRLIAHDQLANAGKSKVIVFLPTTKMTQLYAETLRELARDVLPGARATKVHEIHSKKDQAVRSRTSERFRQDRCGASILVTSDVSARGVDYPGVTRVIQIGVPGSTEQYIHRVGRTGRAGTDGRGDLVLLPYEARFVQSQLSSVPLKEATVDQITAELQQLAEVYDETPSPLSKTPRRDKYFKDDGPPRAFPKPVAPRVTTIGEQIDQAKPHFDQVAVREAFVSMLGYYVTKTVEMQCSKTAIIDGLKDWTTEGMGMSQAPYISQEFLKKIGGHDRGGYSRDRRDSGRSRSAGSWGDRGSSRGGSRSSGGGEWDGGFKPRFGDRDGGSSRPRFGGGRDGSFVPRSSDGGSERRSGGFPLRGRSDDASRRRASWDA